MNIWYIHHYGGGPNLGSYDRPYQLGRAWRAQGHSPAVFIAANHHLLQNAPPAGGEFSIDDVPYFAIPARPYSGNGIGRVLNIFDFSRNLYGVGREYARSLQPPDVVIASSPHPFTIFPAYALARRHRAKLVFEVRDIWPLSITEILGTSRWHPFVLMCAYAEKFALDRADLIASVLPRADRYLADRNYQNKPFLWVPNGTGATTQIQTEPASEPARTAYAKLAAWKAQGKITIIYTGSVGKPNAIDLLVEALAYGNAQGRAGDVAALVVGRGSEVEALRGLAATRNVPNIHFSGPVPKSDVPALLSNADIAYAGLRNVEPVFKYGISPNKIAEYLSASLPVLLPIAPCGDPISESGGGIARKAETPEQVWNALSELVGLSPSARHALGEKGRTYLLGTYAYDRIARRYIDAIEQLAPPAR